MCKGYLRKAFCHSFGLRVLLVLSGLKLGAKLMLISVGLSPKSESECACLFSVFCWESLETAGETPKTTEV